MCSSMCDARCRCVQEYSSAFMGKHWVVRLLTATSDAADFEDLAQDLRELTVCIHPCDSMQTL